MPGPYPGHSDEAFPGVFNLSAMPPQPKEKKPGQLPEEDIRRFFEEVRNAIDVINIRPVKWYMYVFKYKTLSYLDFHHRFTELYNIFYVSCCFISSHA